MTEREAFEQAGYSNEWELWQAACKYQREKDAEILREHFSFTLDLNLIAYAILNQGEKDE